MAGKVHTSGAISVVATESRYLVVDEVLKKCLMLKKEKRLLNAALMSQVLLKFKEKEGVESAETERRIKRISFKFQRIACNRRLLLASLFHVRDGEVKSANSDLSVELRQELEKS